MSDLIKLQYEIDSSKAKKAEKALDDLAKATDGAGKSADKLTKSQKVVSLRTEENAQKLVLASNRMDKMRASAEKAALETQKLAMANAKLKQQLEAASVEAQRAGSSMSQLAAGLGAVVTSLGAGRLISAIGGASNSMAMMSARVKNVVHDTGDYVAVQKELIAISSKTGVSIEDGLKLFQRLGIAQKDLGRSNVELLKLTDLVAKIGVIGGSSNEQMRDGLLQFSQALGSPIVQMEEFRSIIDTMPVLVNKIADGMGMTSGQFIRMVKQGKITNVEVFEAILKNTNKINTEFARMPISFDRAMTSLNNSFVELIGSSKDVESVTFGINQGIQMIANSLRSLQPIAGGIIGSVAAIAAGIGVGGATALVGGPAAGLAVGTTVAAALLSVVGLLQLVKAEMKLVEGVTVTWADIMVVSVNQTVKAFENLGKSIREALDFKNYSPAKMMGSFLQSINIFDPENWNNDKKLAGIGANIAAQGDPFKQALIDRASKRGLQMLDDKTGQAALMKAAQGEGYIRPVMGSITGVFGEQRKTHKHKGTDFAAPVGTNVTAGATGTVVYVGDAKDGYGQKIVIAGKQGNKVVTDIYAHLSKPNVKVGQMVAQGQSIGLSGNTGTSSGPHLHAERRINGVPVDLMSIMRGGNAGNTSTIDRALKIAGNIPVSGVTGAAATAVDEEALKRKQKLIDKVELEIKSMQRLLAARKESEASYENMKNIIEAENMLRAEGVTLTDAEFKSYYKQLKAAKDSADAIKALDKAEEERATRLKKRQEFFGNSLRFVAEQKAAAETELIKVNESLAAAKREEAAYGGAKMGLNPATGQFDFANVEQDLALQSIEAQYQKMLGLNGEVSKYAESWKKSQIAILNTGRATDIAKAKGQEMAQVANTIKEGFADAFADAIVGAKSFSQAMGDLAKMIAKAIIQLLIMKAITAIGKAFGLTAADGAVVSPSGAKRYATGGVVTSPTYFGYAGGNTGLMGEAGPEAILPLTRGANGKLGVKALGGGGSGGNVVNNNVTVNVSGGSSGKKEDDDAMAKKIGEEVTNSLKNMVVSQIKDQQRPGGLLNKGLSFA
ncbi:MAG: hypothetical protein EBR82_09995 [Caulobacteraceae bacterium]|nr:hypothetical protein [Caulobacteraceae bacterium]